MKPGLLKHLLIAFLIALVGYGLLWSGYEHLRTRRGPWEVTFDGTSDTSPRVSIAQPGLGIRGVELVFAGVTVEHSVTKDTVVFDDPRRKPPFGELIFHDLMFLPGTVTLRLFGHEVELLPRVLIIDRQEYPWESGKSIQLTAGSSGGDASKPAAAAPEPQDLP